MFLMAMLYVTEALWKRWYRLDHSQLMTYLDDQGHEQPVMTAEDWAHRRCADSGGDAGSNGRAFPDRSHLPPLDVKVTEELKTEEFTRRSLSFRY